MEPTWCLNYQVVNNVDQKLYESLCLHYLQED